VQAAALAAAALVLAGCSSDGNGEWIAMLKAARGYWETQDSAISLDEASSIPYATVGVRIDGSREQVMVLATDTGDERLWASSGGVAFSTRYGRVVRTAGFGADLTGYVGESGREDWFRPHRVTWSGDFADVGYFSVAVVCDVTPAGRDPIKILGQEFDTVRVDETCRADKLGWTYSNSYWVSATTGRVWRAVVHFHPKGPELDMEILRPPLSQG
jgi:hypothetical protein